jgi:hypothetical protein
MIDLAEGRAVWSGGISLERRLPLNLDVMVMVMGMFMMWMGRPPSRALALGKNTKSKWLKYKVKYKKYPT